MATRPDDLTGGFFDVFQISDPNVRAVLYEYRWSPAGNDTVATTAITYAFPETTAAFDGTVTGFAPATDGQKQAVETAFGLVFSYTNLNATELSADNAAQATVRVAGDSGGTSRASFPTSALAGGELLLNPSNGTVAPPVDGVAQFFGTDGFVTVIHELGHALGLKHGHYELLDDDSLGPNYGPPFNYNVVLSPDVNDNEFSVMTYASYLGSYINPSRPAPTQAADGSAPQSYMMFDIAALQAMYGANYGKIGTKDTYRWDSSGNETINDATAPYTGHSSTNKIFTTIWTQGAIATYDLGSFHDNQVDDLRPGGFLNFSTSQLADLNSDVDPGTPGYIAKGNVYNALLFHNDLSSAIANLITGDGTDTLIGNDRDNEFWAGAGADTISTNGGNDVVHGGAGADTVNFGSGNSVLKDAWADLNGDVVNNFGWGAVDVIGSLDESSLQRVSTFQVTLTGGSDPIPSTVTLNGNFNSGIGTFLVSQRGTGDDLHSTVAFVEYLPRLTEGVAVNTPNINGIASQAFLTGDGSTQFIVDFRSAVSFFANQIGWYKVAADGTIGDVHLLAENTLDLGNIGRSFNLGTPGNNERIGSS